MNNMSKGLKIALIVISILAVISLILNVYLYSLVTGLQNQVGTLEEQVTGIDERVDVIEEQLDKEWTLVGEYTLTNSNQDETFNIAGEKWRLTWNFTQTGTGGSMGTDSIIIHDENQYLIDGLNLYSTESDKGIIYINQGQGTYTVKIAYIPELAGDYTFSFKVESYQ